MITDLFQTAAFLEIAHGLLILAGSCELKKDKQTTTADSFSGLFQPLGNVINALAVIGKMPVTGHDLHEVYDNQTVSFSSSILPTVLALYFSLAIST